MNDLKFWFTLTRVKHEPDGRNNVAFYFERDTKNAGKQAQRKIHEDLSERPIQENMHPISFNGVKECVPFCIKNQT